MYSLPDMNSLTKLLQDEKAYAVIIINDNGEPMAVIDPHGVITPIRDWDRLSDKNIKKDKIVNINGVENITVLCKPIGSACCVTWDDKVKCWC